MKSYEERLPLIDEAIKQGLEEEDGDYVFFGRYLRRFYFGFISEHSTSEDYICTRDEFKQRKAELAAKEQDMNDNWNGNGAPEVGQRLFYLGGNEEREAIVLGVHKDESDDTVIWHKPVDGLYKGGKCFSVDSLCFFRPLRTETDKLIEQMMFHGCQSLNRKEATELVEKGYRKIKQQSEQEFMKQCLDICGHGDARLYRAGCRFVEQVKV